MSRLGGVLRVHVRRPRRPDADPNYATVAAVVVTSFVPFPFGYLAALVAWGVAAAGGLNLSAGRATVLMSCLSIVSVVSRLFVPGVLTAL